MSRTNKDSKIKKELNVALRSKHSGPYKNKTWKICYTCKGSCVQDTQDGHDFICEVCKGEGIIYE